QKGHALMDLLDCARPYDNCFIPYMGKSGVTFNQASWETEFLRRTGMPFKKALQLIHDRDISFQEEFELRTGMPFDHTKMKSETWTMWKWNKKELFDAL